MRSPLVRAISLAAAAMAATTCRSLPAAAPGPGGPPVVIDGRFEDWDGVRPVVVDGVDAAAGSAVDLRRVQVRDDAAWLYLAIDWTMPVNALSMAGAVTVAFDADGDETTGATVFGLDGVDAMLVLSQQERPAEDGHGVGAAVRPVTADGPQALVSAYAVDLLIGPTTAAPRIEVRLRRGTSVGGPALFSGARTRFVVVHEAGGAIADATNIAEHRFADEPGELSHPTISAEALARPAGTIRVVAWNVAGASYLTNALAFQNVIRVLDPDLLLLDELSADSTEAGIAMLLDTADPADAAPWRVVLGESGGRQRTAVASQLPLRAEPRLRRIDYAPGSLVGYTARPGLDPDVEREVGLAATGAWVTIEGRSLLLVPFDLQSRGYAGSPEDRLRVLQAGRLAEFVSQALDTATDPLVILGGDLNAVGSSAPLEVLQRDTRPGQAPLTVADARHLGSGLVYTWREMDSPFTPGQLDYLIYGGRGLVLERAFPFDADDLSNQALADLDLAVNGGENVSDHLPVVGDFRITSSR